MLQTPRWQLLCHCSCHHTFPAVLVPVVVSAVLVPVVVVALAAALLLLLCLVCK